jgi:integrase
MRLLDQFVKYMPLDQKPTNLQKYPPYLCGLKDSQRDALWRKSVRRAGIEDLTFHDLKHEAATRLARFLDVMALAKAIGTKDIKLLNETYYVSDASREAERLPGNLSQSL